MRYLIAAVLALWAHTAVAQELPLDWRNFKLVQVGQGMFFPTAIYYDKLRRGCTVAIEDPLGKDACVGLVDQMWIASQQMLNVTLESESRLTQGDIQQISTDNEWTRRVYTVIGRTQTLLKHFRSTYPKATLFVVVPEHPS
jgi:hypothetical protein